jgi:heterodisulfide reductase subunit C
MAVRPTVETSMIDETFQQQVNRLAHQAIELCYHCHKCTAGCPMAAEMTYGPDRILRMVQFGQREPVLASQDIWLCAGCETCGARCPNDIDIAPVMDALRHIVLAGRLRPGEPRVVLFHRLFLAVVRSTGQMHEAALLGAYKMSSGDLFSDLDSGAKLVLKGKVPLWPRFSAQRSRVQRIFGRSR